MPSVSNVPDSVAILDLTDETDPDSETESESEACDADVEELTPDEFDDFLARKSARESTGRPEHDLQRRATSPGLSNSLGFCDVFEQSCSIFGDVRLRPGDTVQVQNVDMPHIDGFLRIKDIIRDLSRNRIYLQGWRLQRNKNFKGMLNRTADELCMNLTALRSDPRPWLVQGLERVPLYEVIQPVNLLLTNQTFPALKKSGVLICRWMHVAVYKNETERNRGARCEDVVKRISQSESDPGCGIPDTWLWQEWRAGATSLLGSPKPTPGSSRECAIDVEGDEMMFPRSTNLTRTHRSHTTESTQFTHRTREISRDGTTESSARYSFTYCRTSNDQRTTGSLAGESAPVTRRYTFGDGFSGVGGVSRGAQLAGLQLLWSFDKDENACTSYRENFPSTRNYHLAVNGFCDLPGDDYQVDVCHCSPPCQPFSPAHTLQGPDDETNEAALWSLDTMALKCRCRIMTVEQTFGLKSRHVRHYHSVINQFTHIGFSVRAAILNFAEYGLAQARKRLIIIASCPGEVLPQFPRPTHGPGLRPFTTVHDAIGPIPRNFPNHRPELELPQDLLPYNRYEPLRRCITCSGGGNYHPSGKRRFTPRELACLQGIPLEHRFGPLAKTIIKKQIGNAVPPVVYRTIANEIIRSLRVADERTARMEAASSSSNTHVNRAR